MNITPETLTWVFKDPEWKNKFIIGSAFMLASTLIPLIGLLGMVVVYGYGLIIMRAVMRGEQPTLPKWEDIGGMFVDGLKAVLSTLGYYIPGVLLFCCAYGTLFAMAFGGAALSSGASRGVSAGFPFAFFAGELVFFVFFGLGMTVFIIGTVPSPVAVGQYARTGEISAGYRIGQVWRILRTNLAGYLLAWTIYSGLLYISSFSVFVAYGTIILCFLLPFIFAPISFYFALTYAVIFGMAYREGIAKAGIEASA